MKPYILKYDNGEGGRQLGPLIRINEKYREDAGLLAHEVEHVKQWWVTSIICAILWFTFVPMQELSIGFSWLPFAVYHLLYQVPFIQKWIEVRCWRVQLSHYPERIERAAELISTMYDFKMTKEEAIKLLSK